jgi:hypothetical protein
MICLLASVSFPDESYKACSRPSLLVESGLLAFRVGSSSLAWVTCNELTPAGCCRNDDLARIAGEIAGAQLDLRMGDARDLR